MTWNVANYCPELFWDETLYSWVSRWLKGLPIPSVDEGMSHLIGSSSKQLHALLPSFIPKVVEYSLYSAESLVTKHTLVPYFRHFCDSKIYGAMLEDILAGSTQSTYSKLSLLAGRVVDTHLLRYCPHCILDDIALFGIAYWHVSHQLPGVTACCKHEAILYSINKQRGVPLQPPQSVRDNITKATPVAIKLAVLSLRLLTSDTVLFDGDTMAKIYRHRLLQMGLASEALNIHQSELRSALEQYWFPVIDDELIAPIFAQGEKKRYPACLFYSSESHHHPLKHLLMIGFLFDSVDAVWLFAKKMNSSPQVTQQVIKPLRFKPEQLNCALALLRQGNGLREVSRHSKLSVEKVKQLAISHHLDVERRESKLFKNERQVILNRLKRGCSTQDIAKEMACSVGAVEQILTQHPDIVISRKERRFTVTRGAHRARIIVVIKRKNLETRTDIKKKLSASYAWLYKHDKEWLYRELPERQAYCYRQSRLGGNEIN